MSVNNLSAVGSFKGNLKPPPFSASFTASSQSL